MKTAFIILLFGVAVAACDYNPANTYKETIPTKFIADEERDECIWYSRLPRTTLPDSIEYRFVYTGDSISAGSSYKIEWGRKNGKKFTSKTDYTVLGNGTLKYLGYNDNAILFSQGCGTSCSFALVLLLDSAVEKTYSQPVRLNLERNWIVTAYGNNDADTVFLAVENFITDERMNIKGDNLCPSATSVDCIRCCYFVEDTLFVEWEGENWQSDSSADLQRKHYKITIE